MAHDFFVDRNNFTRTDLRESAPLTPQDGEIVLRVERFALTANNITYGVAGDMIGYWQFFPAADDWGRIPVWGIGKVTASQHQNIRVGQRFYGYFPMSSELLVRPDAVSPRGFTDGTPHRASLPMVYNQYTELSSTNGFAPEFDNHAILYRPLFTTSFVLDDYFADHNFFDAQRVILASASSKTAFGMAFMLKRRPEISVTGLTSRDNVDFVKSLGLYDHVLSYDNLESLEQVDSVFVDMAGNPEVRRQVHHTLGTHLKNSCGVGITHWENREAGDVASLPGPKPTMFFAPDQIVKRHKELGPAVYQQQLNQATEAFFKDVDAWVHIEEHPFSQVERVYKTVLDGAPPARGLILTGD